MEYKTILYNDDFFDGDVEQEYKDSIESIQEEIWEIWYENHHNDSIFVSSPSKKSDNYLQHSIHNYDIINSVTSFACKTSNGDIYVAELEDGNNRGTYWIELKKILIPDITLAEARNICNNVAPNYDNVEAPVLAYYDPILNIYIDNCRLHSEYAKSLLKKYNDYQYDSFFQPGCVVKNHYDKTLFNKLKETNARMEKYQVVITVKSKITHELVGKEVKELKK